VQIQQVHDLATLRRFHDVASASNDHDYVAMPADPFEELVPLLDGKERAGELAFLYLWTSEGVPVGTVTLTLPTLDNLLSAHLDLSVHPDHRRRGHARELLRFGIAEVQARGRNRVFMEVPTLTDGPPALALMTEVGAKPVLDDFRRLLDLSTHPAGEPAPVPAGYRVVQWVDHAPDEVVDGAAYLTGRMTLDAPMGEMDYEQEKWDAARYRDKEQAAQASDRMRIATAVVHDQSGAVAGITDIGVNRSDGRVAYQWDTIVDPDHRGHRLGMVLKTWNHRLLTEQVPDVRFVNTWNAASNTFMIAVNDAMGFEPVELWTEWQLDL
jgi:GNAT superfamily N-acetyltransferase